VVAVGVFDFFDRLASGFPAATVFFYWVDEGAAIRNTLAGASAWGAVIDLRHD
jgi:hypothetical protein